MAAEQEVRALDLERGFEGRKGRVIEKPWRTWVLRLARSRGIGNAVKASRWISWDSGTGTWMKWLRAL